MVMPALVLAVCVLIALSGCGGSSDPELAAYVGSWQRVVGGEPDAALTLVVARTDEGATLTFADSSGPRTASGEATVQDGCLVLDMPVGAGILDGVTRLQVSLDAGGQLVVDKVLDDGTTEPVWLYDRAARQER
jgi:hypothetical protein